MDIDTDLEPIFGNIFDIRVLDFFLSKGEFAFRIKMELNLAYGAINGTVLEKTNNPGNQEGMER